MMKLPPYRWVIAAFSILGLLMASGCSEGENIPLSPPLATCERPLDSGWYALNNICENRIPRDSIWLENHDAVTVGDGGLLLETDAVGGWASPNLAISDDLNAISANAHGDLVAAGSNGLVLVRTQGSWAKVTTLENTNWNDVRANGQEMWLAGDNGALAVGTPGQSWRKVEFPDESDLLSVCAFGDSVYVGGRGGLLSVLVDNQWHNMAPSQWGDADISTMVRFPDGRLVAWADSLMIRELDGWRNPFNEYWSLDATGRLKYRDGSLYLPSSDHSYLRIGPDTFSEYIYSYSSSGSLSGGTPGPDGQILMNSDTGAFDWGSPIEEEEFKREFDPSGPLPMTDLRRLDDGTVLSPIRYALWQITNRGLEPVKGFSQELADDFFASTPLAGRSLEDFYVVQGYKLKHVVNRQVVWEDDMPGENYSVIDLKINPQGLVFVVRSRTTLTWDGNQWTVIYDNPEQSTSDPTFMTQNGTFAQRSGSFLFYYSDQGMIPVEYNHSIVSVTEREPGFLEILEGSDNPNYTWWEKGTGASGALFLDPVPGCSGVGLRASCDGPDGVYLATYDHSMVLSLPDDVELGNWGLVAGPSEYEILQLEVLPDGTLVTINRNIKYLMAYRP